MKREYFFFLVAGFSAVTIDFSSYYLISLFISLDLSKAISFALGSVVAYLINNYYTFNVSKITKRNIASFALLYSISFILNVAVNHFLFYVSLHKFLSFFIATLVSTFINFIGQKFWVFKK